MLSFKTTMVFFYMFNRLIFRTSHFLALDCLLCTVTRQIVERKARNKTTCVTIKMDITSFRLQWAIQRLLKAAEFSGTHVGMKICLVSAMCTNYLYCTFVWFTNNLLTDRTNRFKCVWVWQLIRNIHVLKLQFKIAFYERLVMLCTTWLNMHHQT